MRPTRGVPIRPTFAIVVDGDCEVWYFQMLKRNERSIVVNIEPKIPQKRSLSDQYQLVKNLSQDYAKVFWIIDLDNVLKETKEAKKGSKTRLQYFVECLQDLGKSHLNVVVVINNPCIEFWLLLHFEATSKYFDNCLGAEKQLKKSLKDYEKTRKYYTKDGNDIYLKLKPYLPIALKNANKVAKFDPANVEIGVAQMHLFFEAKEFKGSFKIEALAAAKKTK